MNSTSVLLGAGASKEAGAPLAAELTASTLQYFQGVRGWDFDDDTEQALRLLIERLQGSTRAGQRPVDIESLFSALSLLNERNTDLEVTPLIEAWDADVLAADVPGGYSGLPALLRVMNGMTDALAAILRPKSWRLNYLAPLFNIETPVRIASLNYDLNIEEAARLAGLRCDTGIGQWQGTLRPWTWDEEASVRLLKLHGSITWYDATPPPEGPASLSRSFVESEELVHDPSHYSMGNTQVIYGRRGKLRPEGPYLAMLEAWRNWLADTNRLLVIGYSFSDDHINQTVRAWLATYSTANLVIVDPYLDWNEEVPNPFLAFLREACSTRVQVIQASCGEAIRQVLGEGVSWATPVRDRWGLPIEPER